MENNNTLRVGDVVRLKLKPEVTGVINAFFNSYGQNWGYVVNLNRVEGTYIDAHVLLIGDDLKTELKKFPVLMLEKV